MKLIFHLDLDSFFVSAARLRDPQLIGKPVAVGGTGPRAVLSSASYEARRWGVRSAMPTAQALRLCSQLVIVEPDFSLYSDLSKKVFQVIEKYAPVFERVSVDEGYLDMTGTEKLFGPPLEAAARIRAEIAQQVGLPSSVGIGSNRLVAKIATDQAKPNGELWVLPGTEAVFLAPLAVSVIPGVGPATTKWLHEHGFFKISDLQSVPAGQLEAALGEHGQQLWDRAHGRGSTEFFREAKNPSISRETTFSKDVRDPERIERLIWGMCEELGRELRSEDRYATTVRLKLRYPPFETVARSRVLDLPTRLDRDLFEAAHALLLAHWAPDRPLRLVGVGFAVGEGVGQFQLFESPENQERWARLDQLKDRIRAKFGHDALGLGRNVKTE